MATPMDPSEGFSVDILPSPVQSYAQELLKESPNSPAAAYDTLEAKIRLYWLECLADSSIDQLQTVFAAFRKFCVAVLESNEDKYGVLIRKLPFVLLEDAVDVLVSTKLLEFWTAAVEPTTLCAGRLWNTTKSNSHVLQWIRACNSLLRKLSTTTTTTTTSSSNDSSSAITGRILMDLAQVLPLHDRSSIKQWGSVSHAHDGSTTSYYQEEGEYEEDLQEAAASSNTTEETSTPSSSSPQKDSPLQYSLYETFWSLQRDFANPYAISFTTFLPNMRTILATLESQSVLSKGRNTGESTTPSSSSTSSNTTLTYLTRGRLLPIQLQDPLFCQFILTQFLIIESFVSSQSTQLQTTLRDLTTRAKALLERSRGNEQLETLQWLLKERESMWRNWKKNKCKPEMEIVVKEGEEGETKKRLLDGPLATTTTTSTPHPDQDDKPLSMEELAVISKGMSQAVPDVYSYLEDYVDALDPDAGIEEEYHPKNDKLFSWRALRLLSRRHLPLFRMVQKGNGDFERMVRHVYQEERNMEIPGDAPEEEALVDYDVDTAAKNAETKEDAKQVEGDVEMEEDKEESVASVGDAMSDDEEGEEEGEEHSTGTPAEEDNLNDFEKAALEEEAELMLDDSKDEEEEDEVAAEAAKTEKAAKTQKEESKPPASGTEENKRKRRASRSPEAAPRGGDHGNKRWRGEEQPQQQQQPRGGGGGGRDDFRGGGPGRGGRGRGQAGRGGAGRGRQHPNFEPARRPMPPQQNAPGRGHPPPPRRDDDRRRQNSGGGGRRDNRRRTY